MVTTICYKEKRNWDSRKEAMDFFLEGMMNSEGSEQSRYTKIYTELMMGLKVCKDME